jgi:hypothetical protein
MKQITNKTILKQGNKTYQPIEVDGVIYWYEEDDFKKHYPKAQSQYKFEGVPIINLDETWCHHWINKATPTHKVDAYSFKLGYKLNPNKYTQKDIEKAISFGFDKGFTSNSNNHLKNTLLSKDEFIEQINSISVIEVDESFNVISYE